MKRPSLSATPSAPHLGDTGADAHLYAELGEQIARGDRYPLRQRGQDTVGGLDQHDVNVLGRIDAVHAVGDHGPHRSMQLGGELRPRGPGPDDRHMQLAGTHGPGLAVGPKAGVDDAAVEATGLLGRIEGYGMLGRPRRSEVVCDAADRHDQGVVGHVPGRRDLAAVLVMHGAEFQALMGAVETDDLGIGIVEMAPLGLREVVQLVLRSAQAAGGDRMQQRLPKVGSRTIHQGDPRLAGLAQGQAEFSDQFQAGRAAAGDHDVVRGWPPCLHALFPSPAHLSRSDVRSNFAAAP